MAMAVVVGLIVELPSLPTRYQSNIHDEIEETLRRTHSYTNNFSYCFLSTGSSSYLRAFAMPIATVEDLKLNASFMYRLPGLEMLVLV
jgi:hypothetical protein